MINSNDDRPVRFTGMMSRNSHKVLARECLERMKARRRFMASRFEAVDFVGNVFNDLAGVGRDSQHEMLTYIITEYARQFDWTALVDYLEEEVPEKFLYLEG